MDYNMSVFEEKQVQQVIFRNTISVDSKEMASIAKDLEVLLNKSTLGAAVAFRLKGNRLEIRCFNLAFYKAVVFSEEQYEECEVVVVYKSISKMLPSTGLVQVTLSPAGVELKSPVSEITLYKNIATVDSYEVENFGFTGFDYVKVRTGLKELLSTTSIINSIGTAVNINMLGKFMHCKYATVYLECPSSGIVNSITKELGKVLLNFLFGDDVCFFAESGGAQVFKKGNRYLLMPLNPVKEKSIMDLVNVEDVLGTMNVNGLGTRVKEIVQAYGNGVGRVDFYDGKVTINRQDSYCKISTTVGGGSEHLISIDVNLEHFRDVLAVIGDSFTLYRRGGKACLRSLDGHVSII